MDAAVGVGERIAPTSARVDVQTADGRVHVRITAAVAPPGGLFARLGSAPVSAEAVAVVEGP